MKRQYKRALAVILVIALVWNLFPGMPQAMADVHTDYVIDEIEELPDEILYQHAAFGTLKKDLELPDQLEMLVRAAEEDEDEEIATLSQAARTSQTETEVSEALVKTASSSQAEADGTETSDTADSADDTTDSHWRSVQVEWVLDAASSEAAEYDGEQPGIYIFDAEPASAHYMIGEAVLPSIQVEVLEESSEAELAAEIELTADYIITSWEWADTENLTDGALIISGNRENEEVALDDVTALLPKEIRAEIEATAADETTRQEEETAETGETAAQSEAEGEEMIDASSEEQETSSTSETIELDGWTCEEFGESVTEGEYTFTASLPEGYELAESMDALEIRVELGGGMLLTETVVASVEIDGQTTEYADLSAAFAAANGNTAQITLLTDGTATPTISRGNVVLDLNGYTMNGKIEVSGGSLTIGGGSLIGTTSSSVLYCGGGSLTLNDGIYSCEGRRYIVRNNGGTVVVNGGSFGKSNGELSLYHYSGTTTVNGGQFYSEALMYAYGSMRLYGGKFMEKLVVDSKAERVSSVGELLGADRFYKYIDNDIWITDEATLNEPELKKVEVRQIPFQITGQPENKVLYYNYTAEEAWIAVDAKWAEDANGDMVYQWYRIGEDGTPEMLTDENGYAGTADSVLHLPAGWITGTRNSYYCVVSCDGWTEQSKTAEVSIFKCGDQHEFDENGFCIKDGAYQMPEQNASGKYEITNAGNLFWFAALVNGDSTNASEVTDADASADAVLNTDIDLESRLWTAIGSEGNPYTGTFDGNGYTVNNFCIEAESSYQGLFGYCGSGSLIQDVTVEGSISITGDNVTGFGGIAGRVDGGTVRNVVSCVDVSNTGGTVAHAGGVIGRLYGGARLEQALNFGNVTISNSSDCIGGVAANMYAAAIENCANLGTVFVQGAEGAYMGGIVGYNNSDSTIRNCYNFGEVYNDSGGSKCGAVIGWARDSRTKLENCYYWEDSSDRAVGFNGYDDTKEPTGIVSEDGISSKSEDAFYSGEVAWLLNGGELDTDTGEVTTEPTDDIWKQTLGDDNLPVFSGDTVYIYIKCNAAKVWTNDESMHMLTLEHNMGADGICTICGEQAAASVSADDSVKYYDTIEKAWTAARETGSEENPAVVTLLTDVQAAETLVVGDGNYIILKSGTSENGDYTISGSLSKQGIIQVNGGSFTLSSGGLSNSLDSGSYANAYGILVKGGNVLLEGGKIGGGEYAYEYGAYIAGGDVEVRDGCTIAVRWGAIYVNGGSLQVNGGTIESYDNYAIGVWVNSQACIDGGKISGKSNGAYVGYSGKLEVISGEITGGTYGLRTEGDGSDSEPEMTIKGGDIEGGKYGLYCGSGMNKKLFGGVFTGGTSSIYIEYEDYLNQKDLSSMLGSEEHRYYVLSADGTKAQIDDGILEWQWRLWTADGYGTVTVMKPEPVARVTVDGESEEYYSIESAWKAAKESSSSETQATVTLLQDVTVSESLTVEDGDNIILESEKSDDGGQYSISSESVTNGIIYVDGGSFEMKGGNIFNNYSGAYYTTSRGIYIIGGTVKVSGGEINDNDSSSLIAYGVQISGGELEICDSAVINTQRYGINATGGTTQVNGGTITSNTWAINLYSQNGGKVIINSGEIAGSKYGAFVTYGTLEITGGEIYGGEYGVDFYDNSNILNILNISGGAISGGTYGLYMDDNYGGNMDVTISGGTFTGGEYSITSDKSSLSMADLLADDCNYYAVDGSTTALIENADSLYALSASDGYGTVTVMIPGQKPEEEISVSIEWGEMSFVYNKGTWNPETHTYDGGGWRPVNSEGNTDENANRIAVTNNGSAAVTVGFSFAKADGLTQTANLTGSFRKSADGAEEISSVTLNPEAQSQVWLRLDSDEPAEGFENQDIGIVTVTIGSVSEEDSGSGSEGGDDA